jgi:4-hydroxybenzoate polyprenyltransferase
VSAQPTTVREGQTFEARSRLVHWVNFVKLPHTVFALPFALVGVVIASYRAPVTIAMVGWVVLAFTAARFVGMGVNRIVDRDIDARNPRTAMRELPSGLLGVREAWVSVAVASALFVLACAQLNPLVLLLSPVALAWVSFYSWTKRFTRWSHLVLGFGMSIAPVGGYLAVTGRWSEPWWLLIALSAAVTTWGAGFDILYSTADEGFDRANALHSVPAAFGIAGAIRISRALHVLTVAMLVLVGVAAFPPELRGAWWYWAGVILASGLLLKEHRLVHAHDLSKLDAAFFLMNGVISIALFALALLARLAWRGPAWLAAPLG